MKASATLWGTTPSFLSYLKNNKLALNRQCLCGFAKNRA
jgi:hypothetical protein